MTVTDLYSHFYNLYGSDYNSGGGTNNDMTSIHNIILDDELDSEFTTLEIKEAVFSQNNSKSPGIDKLTAEVFKSSFDIISPFLTTFYNKLYNEGVFPKSWGEGIIVPIFKRGSQEAKNCRGITLNNILSKIYSKLLVTRLTKWSIKMVKSLTINMDFKKTSLQLIVSFYYTPL